MTNQYTVCRVKYMENKWNINVRMMPVSECRVGHSRCIKGIAFSFTHLIPASWREKVYT